MSLNLSQIRQRVRIESGNDKISNNDLDAIINSTVRVICSEIYSKFMESTYTFSTVANTAVYTLPPNFDKMKWVRSTTSGNEQIIRPIVDIDKYWEENPNPTVTGAPYRYLIENTDAAGLNYLTGSVTSTLNSRTIVGTGTSWVTAGVKPGSRFIFQGKTYNVSSVDSATGITLVQKATVGVTGVSYSIETMYDQQIRFDSIPDGVYSITLHYWRIPSPMINDNDYPEIKGKFVDGIVAGAIKTVRRFDEDATFYLISKDEFNEWLKRIATWNEDELDEMEQIQSENFKNYSYQ